MLVHEIAEPDDAGWVVEAAEAAEAAAADAAAAAALFKAASCSKNEQVRRSAHIHVSVFRLMKPGCVTCDSSLPSCRYNM